MCSTIRPASGSASNVASGDVAYNEAMSSTFLTSAQLADARALLDRLIAEHKAGHALQREFQIDPGLYQLDLERIWRRGWLFAGHTCQVKHPGD